MQPFMDFYKTGAIRYGKINENICNLMENTYMANTDDCKAEIAEMNIQTAGKGYLIMKQNGTAYTL